MTQATTEEVQEITPTRADVVCLRASRVFVETWAKSGPPKVDKKLGEILGTPTPTTPELGTFNIPMGQVVVRKIPSVPNVREGYWVIENWSRKGIMTGSCEIIKKPVFLEALAVELAVDCSEEMQNKAGTGARKIDTLVTKFGMLGALDQMFEEVEEVVLT